MGAHLFYLQLRAYYYIVLRNVEDDEEAQKRGVVCCAYCVGGGFDFDLQLIRHSFNLRNALPVRYDSVHACYNDLRAHAAFSLTMFRMGAHSRIRFRTHYGSHEECQCRLSSFGVPISAFPVSPEGEFNLEDHRTFMARERSIEATKSNGPLGVAQQANEKARSRQPIIEEDDFVAVPHPDVNESTGYGRFTSISNLGFLLPRSSFAIPWRGVVGAPNLPPVVPPQRQLPVVPQFNALGPRSISIPPAKLCKSPTKSYVIYDPLPNDILLGRGKPIQQRPGNVRFREMLDKHIGKYDKGEKGAKAGITTSIVHLVKEKGGRFLKELEHGGWVEVDEATARAKVSHSLRTRRSVFQATLNKDKSIV